MSHQLGGGLKGDYKDSEKELFVGLVSACGKNLPLGKNMADYIDVQGRMQLIQFYGDHKKEFLTLWKVVQCEASCRVVEVGCERFFALSGYISAPKCTRLGVRNYERVAMLSSILKAVYADPEWVAQEYLRRCKNGAWKEGDDQDALKCWNLEQLLEAATFGQPKPTELTMSELTSEVKCEEQEPQQQTNVGD